MTLIEDRRELLRYILREEDVVLNVIKDNIEDLDPWEMQKLVAGLLVAMGFHAEDRGKGPDGGVDVLAYNDALGMEKPMIKVQVKHRKKKVASKEVQQLIGANPLDARSLFISTSGFTPNALSVASQASVRIIDLDELIRMVVEWYEEMPGTVKALVPLRKIYVPELI
ncbi:restriction endonuclease [Ornithinibacillus salinisoli]|uniref:Restriction endonuclease n=1 Tax=Ornithinibacillus salinisoli TaxID=1848459 RepID=A0ABW4W707_9BACI